MIISLSSVKFRFIPYLLSINYDVDTILEIRIQQ